MKFAQLLPAVVLSLSAMSAHANPFMPPSYSLPGTPAITETLFAISTGNVVGTFVSSSAGGEDTVRMFDVTSNSYSGWRLDNRTSTAGTMANFGHVTAGDVLVFEINNADLVAGSYYVTTSGVKPHPILASDAAYSADKDSHAYAVSYPAGTLPGVGEFTYFGMEDLPAGVSDFDYNDLTFLASNVSVGQAPEPESLVLLGTGLLGLGGAIRRRLTA